MAKSFDVIPLIQSSPGASNRSSHEGTTQRLLLKDSLPQGWQPTSYTPTTFLPEHFDKCMDNMIRNPNVTSSHLFRADILYDSDKDKSLLAYQGQSTPYVPSEQLRGSLVQHMRAEVRPKHIEVQDFRWRRTVVRQLIPRNKDLDKSMVQTCHFFTNTSGHHDEETDEPSGEWQTNLVIYQPHIHDPDDMPFYHPKVSGLCFAHTCRPAPPHPPSDPSSEVDPSTRSNGGIALHLLPYPSLPLPDLDPKLSRTTLKLLQTISKHAHGAAQGYTKRVHHDQIIPQSRFQDTYSRLKSEYAKQLIETWAEVTDPGKHVFEDLGIAAFLIELWRDIYRGGEFPGFVDIGCGNGLLTYLLHKEGFEGWGFDVRRRKSWAVYQEDASMVGKLVEAVLVPEVLMAGSGRTSEAGRHDGMFKPGTFIVSNHADELTAWTPLLAWLNNSPWIAIPCCSHDFGGRRFRAPSKLRKPGGSTSYRDIRPLHALERLEAATALREQREAEEGTAVRARQAAETGSLKRSQDRGAADDQPEASEQKPADNSGESVGPTGSAKQQPSAYASLCGYVQLVGEAIGYEPEKEMLRIPSTRNACIVGRKLMGGAQAVGCPLDEAELGRRRKAVIDLIENEMLVPLEKIGEEWLQRAGLIASKKGTSH